MKNAYFIICFLRPSEAGAEFAVQCKTPGCSRTMVFPQIPTVNRSEQLSVKIKSHFLTRMECQLCQLILKKTLSSFLTKKHAGRDNLVPKIGIWTTKSVTISHGKVQNTYPNFSFLSMIREPHVKWHVYSQLFFYLQNGRGNFLFLLFQHPVF